MATITTLLGIIVFMLGIYFYTQIGSANQDGFTNDSTKPNCPDMLIQTGSRFYLYNSKIPNAPGVNPIEFDNLEDYTLFLDWQRTQGVRCPVLYLQSTFDAQGNSVYKIRPSVTEPQAGLPPSSGPDSATASYLPIMDESTHTLVNPNPTLLIDATQNDPPYNKGSYPSHDESSYYIGTTTPLDEMNYAQQNAEVSPNPMDENWGGAAYTQSLVDKGFYKDNEVKLRV